MDFILLTGGSVVLLVGLLMLLARAYPGSGADLLDWKPTRSYETEVQLEQDDVRQMIEAQNEYRRKRGAPELTHADASRMAAEDEEVRDKARPGYEKRLRITDPEGRGLGSDDDAR